MVGVFVDFDLGVVVYFDLCVVGEYDCVMYFGGCFDEVECWFCC